MKTKLALLSLLSLAVGCVPDPKLETGTYAEALGVDLSASQKLPSGMYIRDTTEGTGTVAANGNAVTMRYTGWLANGTQFDSNQGRGFSFVLGDGVVIPGWDLGVPGMKVGGTRQLIIPPSLGYGASGQGPIPPNAILVFSVTMVSTP
jgi:FKBP-type peptidyl-prolyl cis-trans isomerase